MEGPGSGMSAGSAVGSVARAARASRHARPTSSVPRCQARRVRRRPVSVASTAGPRSVLWRSAASRKVKCSAAPDEQQRRRVVGAQPALGGRSQSREVPGTGRARGSRPARPSPRSPSGPSRIATRRGHARTFDGQVPPRGLEHAGAAHDRGPFPHRLAVAAPAGTTLTAAAAPAQTTDSIHNNGPRSTTPRPCPRHSHNAGRRRPGPTGAGLRLRAPGFRPGRR